MSPITQLLDKIIPDPRARDAAKLELLKLQGSQEMDALRVQLSAIVTEAGSTDPWTSRARPSFLYVMYAIILWAIPMGLIAATQPEMAKNIAAGMNAYLGGFPIARALAEGADVVITGRCVDSAVTLGALIHAFSWTPEDLDRLAAGTLCGHIIECGAQCNGGNFTAASAIC